ncbi:MULTISPECIES: type VI secretion system baseplate subunit TssE [Marinobacter]|uniref:Type VI secretion system baseplate subunit TssE n=1 Tax=Marinobacter xestospongiae TaxID=994319 RepID=A0ABU3VXC6_9GAMM|nr:MULTISPECIES: type VI secretion system baseplate subunit TssE [Marinobacter]MDV2078923.1 type VI secretion system baseplate subunit TssE [Marinobacter xestospongiae]UDL04787.1 type VI secretion system baseplate subunit TssE [Marinobacter sp. CA1]
MPIDSSVRLQMSLLDRLAADGDARATVSSIRQSVRQDLEALLNTRRSWLELPAELRELKQSVLGFGLPDFTVMDLSTTDARQWLCEEIRQTIIRFEPRLTRVSVEAEDGDTPLNRQLRLRIDAILLVDPVPEPVAFQSDLEPINLSMTLQECA